jgi:DeoR/GlpR family transcriptional regulator of sugar metabolism
MLAIERQRRILDLVLRDRRVVVNELSERFGVAEETVRRDLHKLEREGLLDRTHGGAVARQDDAEDLPYPVRQTINLDAKRRIAANAYRLVKDGDAVMIDSSSTAFEILPHLRQHRHLTLITNSVRILADAKVTSHAIVSTGGELRQQSLTFVGPLATEALSRFNADVAFISCKGISRDAGITDASVADAEIKRAFINHARRVFLLVDGDKFDAVGLIGVAPFERLAAIVTDRRPPDAWMEFLAARNVDVIH